MPFGIPGLRAILSPMKTSSPVTVLARSSRMTLVSIAALVLLLSACGSADVDTDGTDGPGPSSSSNAATAEDSEDAPASEDAAPAADDEAGADSTDGATGDAGTDAAQQSDDDRSEDSDSPGEISGGFGAFGDEDLPGEVIEIYPYAGDELMVVGVSAGENLPVLAAPGTLDQSLTHLDPLTTHLIATGHNRSLEDDFWVELDVDGLNGWVFASHVAQPGQVSDITAELGAISAATIEELAERAAAQRASTQPPSRITIVSPALEADLVQINVDVLDLGDDSVLGERLRIFAAPEGDGYAVHSVESTMLCLRGVSEGLCV